MHVQLRAGEQLLPGTQEAANALLARPEVAAVLMPLRPDGQTGFSRAADRYMRAWDARFLHPQTHYAPGARVATRTPLPGPLSADAAPFLADAIARGARVELAPTGGVATPAARDLGTWITWARDEGTAWGALAARDERFPRFLPATTRLAWTSHNVQHIARRVGEAMQALRRPDLLAALLHVTREATWTGAARRAFQSRARP